MDHLLIENKGLIDINALILMGGSTKIGDNTKIGQWGSGAKYALACLIRENIPFKIFSGTHEINITTKEVSFRDKSFSQIIIDGNDTSLTTQMGFDWEVWMAIRELLCNSLDEEQSNTVTSMEPINPRAGYTRIYIEHTPSVKEVIDHWNDYFAFDRSDVLYEDNKGNRILGQNNKEENCIFFRKGIRCFNDESKALFQYDLTSFIINESRIVNSKYSSLNAVGDFLANCTNKNVIHTILSKAYNEKTVENEVSWRWGVTNMLNPVWKEVIGTKKIIPGEIAGYFIDEQQTYPHYIVCNSLSMAIKRSFPEVEVLGLDADGDSTTICKEVEATPKMDFLLKECMKFFEETKYEIKYPIVIADFVNNENRLGLARDNTIYISKKLFNMGKREIVAAIVEENEHLNTNYKDCTRAFQQHFIDLFISEKEERFAYFC